MSVELRDFLDGRGHPELIDIMVALDEVLVTIGFTAHQDEYDFLITIESSEPQDAILEDVTKILRVGVDTAMQAFGLGISDLTPLKMLLELVPAVGNFYVGDDADALSSIVESEMPSDEAFCEFLELRTQWSAEEWMPYILTVPDTLIETIGREVDKYQETSENQGLVDLAIKNRVDWFHEQEENVASKIAVSDGVPYGTSMESLYNVYGDQLAGMSMGDAITGLVSLTLMSDVSLESVHDEAAHFLEDLYPDLESSQKAHRLLREKTQRLTSYQPKGGNDA